MRFFLDTFIGDGTEENPFRSEHSDGDMGIIDLRADGTQQAGFCLVGAEGVNGTPLVDFGDTLDQKLKTNRIRQLANRLELILEQTDFRAIIAELLLVHGREDGTRWRGLKATSKGRHEIVLGGQLVYSAPVIMGASFTDDFNRGDEVLETSANWTEIAGDCRVVSNEIDTFDGGENLYRCESTLDSDDHSCQITVTNAHHPSVICRFDTPGTDTSANSSFYMHRFGTNNSKFELYKRVTGSFTLLDDLAEADPTEPYDISLEVDGSSIKGFLDGVEKTTATDSAITGHLLTGTRETGTTGRWDDFNIADLAAAVSGAGAITEQTDDATGAGNVLVSGSGAITESSDNATGAGTILVSGAGAITEQPDNASGAGNVLVSGAGAVAEDPDDATGAGTSGVLGSGAITEQPDNATGIGTSGAVAVLIAAVSVVGRPRVSAISRRRIKVTHRDRVT